MATGAGERRRRIERAAQPHHARQGERAAPVRVQADLHERLAADLEVAADRLLVVRVGGVDLRRGEVARVEAVPGAGGVDRVDRAAAVHHHRPVGAGQQRAVRAVLDHHHRAVRRQAEGGLRQVVGERAQRGGHGQCLAGVGQQQVEQRQQLGQPGEAAGRVEVGVHRDPQPGGAGQAQQPGQLGGQARLQVDRADMQPPGRGDVVGAGPGGRVGVDGAEVGQRAAGRAVREHHRQPGGPIRTAAHPRDVDAELGQPRDAPREVRGDALERRAVQQAAP